MDELTNTQRRAFNAIKDAYRPVFTQWKECWQVQTEQGDVYVNEKTIDDLVQLGFISITHTKDGYTANVLCLR